jgi:hypothetical protein
MSGGTADPNGAFVPPPISQLADPNGAFVPPPISQLSVAPAPVGAPALSRRVSEKADTDRVFLTAVAELVREKASMPLQCQRSAGRSRDGQHIWKSGPEAARMPVKS